MDQAHKTHLRKIAYLAGFFHTISISIAAYINSSFLEQFLPEKMLGLAYAASSLLSILFSLVIIRLIKRVGNRSTIITLGLLNILAISGLIIFDASPLAVFFWIIYEVLIFLLVINLDLYVESLSDDRTTGRIRGIYLTTVNFAWLLSPFLAGKLIAHYDFSAVYMVALGSAVIFLYLVIRHLVETTKPEDEKISIRKALGGVLAANNLKSSNLRRLLMADFMLSFFYAIMVVYMPIYLSQHIGLSWEQIGLIFTIMLIPFVVLDFALGLVADKLWGEKEIMAAGILIAALAAITTIFVRSPIVPIWALVLFGSRVGAASWEMMKETYFFKKIDGRDANVLFVFRNAGPLAYIIAPLLASLFLAFFDFRFLFPTLGAIILLGLIPALRLRDTK